MKGTCNTATACTTQQANNEKIVVDVRNTTCESSEDTASDSTHQEDTEDSNNSTSQPSSPVEDPQTKDPEVHSVSRVSIREVGKGSHKHTSEKVIISVKHSTPITSGTASTDFVPCSQEDFSSEGILLAARQQKLETDRKDREKVIRGEIEEEQRRKVEERLKLEQHLLLEEQERKRELQRKQIIEKQEQRLQEKRVLKEKEDRLQQQILEKQKKEEEQQRREFLKQRELERVQKRREEAESRAQQLREEQIRLQQEEKARLERQCQFPDIIETQAVNMASVNLSQNIHPNSRGPVNRQQLYPYNNFQKRQQTHRSSTASSIGETPMKQGGARNSPNSMLNAEQMQMHSADGASPLFLDRLLDGEVRDFREFTKIIEKQNREIVELKNTNNEMEDRLEYQTRERIDLEETIEEQEKIWDERCKQLSKERDDFDKALQAEQTTNRKLWDIVYAKEKEIQRQYQRRYDGSSQANRRGPHQRGPERGVNHQRSVVDRQSGFNALRSPHDLLEAKGSAQTAQERNAIHLLEGFFGC